MPNAALYLRSSKDRKDVSIEAQRLELKALATARNLRVVEEFSDVVESGKDEDRAGFQSLITAVRNERRGWDAVLIYDTSRLARRRLISMTFEEVDCRRYGVQVIYKSLPDSDDPATTVLLKAVVQGVDEYHSIVSRMKGLAGMRENVRRGYRAGGRAPLGYQLKKVDMGIVREGQSITKSVLVPAANAGTVARFLEARARGIPRVTALRECGLDVSPTTAIGMEWNALTYAGNTVWNVHNDNSESSPQAKRKRRPRSEWMIKEKTHPALITVDQAERILHQIQNSSVGAAVSAAKRGVSAYLLTGLLQSPDGGMWEGNQQIYYRAPKGGRRRYVPAGDVDQAVLAKLQQDLQSEAFVDQIWQGSRKPGNEGNERKKLQAEIQALAKKVDQAMEAALQLEDPGPAYRKVDALESERKRLAKELSAIDADSQLATARSHLTKARLGELLADVGDNIKNAAPERRKALLRDVIQRVVLDPKTLDCHLHYQMAAEGSLCVAFPRGFEPLLHP